MLASLGFLLLVAGFGFKMSLVPFHAWSPDTYQGAPSPFVAFLSVAPKVASALVLYRLLDAVVQGGAAAAPPSGPTVVAILSVLSMVVGNLLALVQRDIKRMLAYSGIAHMGYLLLALVTLDRASLMPVLVYLLAYALMNAGAFAVVALLYSRPGEQHLISDLAGWGYRYPAARRLPRVCMLSLGGIPPTARLPRQVPGLPQRGRATATSASPSPASLASLVGVFYYLRVVYVLYMKPETRQPEGLLIDVWGRAAARGRRRSAPWRSASGPRRLLHWLIAATGREVNELGRGLPSHPQPALVLPALPAPSPGARHRARLLAGAGAALPPLRHPDPQGPRAVRRVRHPRRRLRGRRTSPTT